VDHHERPGHHSVEIREKLVCCPNSEWSSRSWDRRFECGRSGGPRKRGDVESRSSKRLRGRGSVMTTDDQTQKNGLR